MQSNIKKTIADLFLNLLLLFHFPNENILVNGLLQTVTDKKRYIF